MGCFEKLVKSKFLANVSSELRLARQAVLSVTNTNLTPTIYGSKKDRKSLYDDYVYYFYLLEEIVDSLEEPDCVKTMIYYIKYDTVMFIYSMDKGQVEDARLLCPRDPGLQVQRAREQGAYTTNCLDSSPSAHAI